MYIRFGSVGEYLFLVASDTIISILCANAMHLLWRVDK